MAQRRRRGKGEGGIRQRADGRREATVEVGWRDGTRIRRSIYGRTRAEVAEKLRKAQVKADRGLPLGDERRTVAKLLDSWLERQRQSDKAAATLDQYQWAIEKHLKPALGRRRVVHLATEDVEEMLILRAHQGAAKSTLVRIRTVLSMALRDAVRRDQVARNAAELAETPAGPKRLSRSLTVEDARRLLQSAEGDRLGAAYITMLMLGLRPGEALGLRWDDVDLDAGIVKVRQALRRGHDSRLEPGVLKTAGSRRTLAAPGPVVDALHAHRRRQLEERMRVGLAWHDTGLVFTTEIGTFIDPRNFRGGFARLCSAAELGAWRPHELRHSAVSLLSAAGVAEEEDIADVVGHVTTRMTHQVYRHQVTPTIDAGKRAMEGLFGRKLDSGKSGG